VNDTSLALAADIERRDADVAVLLDLVARLSRRADELGLRSEEVQRFRETVPGELARLDRVEAEARDAAAAAANALDDIERRVADLPRRDAELELENARRVASEAAARGRHVTAERTALLEREASSRVEIGDLTREAGEVAACLNDIPRVSESGREPPGETLADVSEWARRVHAALFVVRGQLESERDRLIREANELAGAVLGEQLSGSNVSLVRKRLEEARR